MTAPTPPHPHAELRIAALKALSCLFLDVDEAVADDVRRKVVTYVDTLVTEIERLQEERDEWRDRAMLSELDNVRLKMLRGEDR